MERVSTLRKRNMGLMEAVEKVPIMAQLKRKRISELKKQTNKQIKN